LSNQIIPQLRPVRRLTTTDTQIVTNTMGNNGEQSATRSARSARWETCTYITNRHTVYCVSVKKKTMKKNDFFFISNRPICV